MSPGWYCGKCGFYNYGHRRVCRQSGCDGCNPVQAARPDQSYWAQYSVPGGVWYQGPPVLRQGDGGKGGGKHDKGGKKGHGGGKSPQSGKGPGGGQPPRTLAQEEREMWMAMSEEQVAVQGQSLSQSHRDQLAHARAMANFGLQGAQAEAQQANLQIGKFSQQVLHQKQRLAKLEEQAQQAIMAAVVAKQQLEETEKQLGEAKRRAAEHLGAQGLAQQIATDTFEAPIKEALGKFEQAVPSELAPQLQGAVDALRAAMAVVAQQAAAALQGRQPGGAAASGGTVGAAAAGAGASAARAGGAGAGAQTPGAQGGAGGGADAERDVKMVEADGGVLIDLRSQRESDGKLTDPEVQATIQSLFSKATQRLEEEKAE
ncbi:unnamed protein product, partial [Prorocentrum cordatum]